MYLRDLPGGCRTLLHTTLSSHPFPFFFFTSHTSFFFFLSRLGSFFATLVMVCMPSRPKMISSSGISEFRAVWVGITLYACLQGSPRRGERERKKRQSSWLEKG